MNKTVLIILGVVGLLGLLFALTFMGAANQANGYEKSIKFAHEQSRNVLGQYAPKIREALGVTQLQAEALEEIITAANDSRYGEDGSQATMQWIREQNPLLDQSTFSRVQNMIEAGRNDFRNAQTDKLDRIRGYETALGHMPGSFFMKMAGYPTQAYTAANYGKIVISGHADDSFTTGIDDGLDIGN